MEIAIVLWDRFTALDAVGPYQVLSLLPGADVKFVAEAPGPVRNEIRSLAMVADHALSDVTSPDLVIVPGGMESAQLDNRPLLDWLQAVDATTTWTTSVCTGSLILAAAGLLTGRRATTHWASLEGLKTYDATPVSERVVVDEKYVTAAGVSSGIDMALSLAGTIAGEEVAQAIQLLIEYDPQPPFDTGSPAKAGPKITENVRTLLTAATAAR
jgi:transcriptional regulator GlxA family with amidase domain